jgi:thioredoxin reductase
MKKKLELYDIIIYGGHAAGIMAAVQVARMGMRPLVLEPREDRP